MKEEHEQARSSTPQDIISLDVVVVDLQFNNTGSQLVSRMFCLYCEFYRTACIHRAEQSVSPTAIVLLHANILAP